MQAADPASRKRRAGESAGERQPAKAAKAAQEWVSWRDVQGSVFLAEKQVQVEHEPGRAERGAESDGEDVVIVKVTSVNGK